MLRQQLHEFICLMVSQSVEVVAKVLPEVFSGRPFPLWINLSLRSVVLRRSVQLLSLDRLGSLVIALDVVAGTDLQLPSLQLQMLDLVLVDEFLELSLLQFEHV